MMNLTRLQQELIHGLVAFCMNNISIQFYSFKVLMTPVLMTNGRADCILSTQGRIPALYDETCMQGLSGIQFNTDLGCILDKEMK